MNKNFQHEATYHQSLDALAFSETAKRRMTQKLLAEPTPNRTRLPRRLSAAAMAAVLSLLLALSAAAAFFAVPTLRAYYRNSPGYLQSAVEWNQSLTKNGWTMTLTDCVMDEYSIYVGVNLTPPTGVALDAVRAYRFDDWSIRFDGEEHIGGTSHYELIRSGSPEDASLRLILWSTCPMRDTGRESLAGRTLYVSLGRLYHHGTWDETEQQYDRIVDCPETWDFAARLTPPEKTITVEPDAHIVTLDVDASITRIEVTPIGAYIYIEGDALKGHHAWVPKNAPDGWYGCVEYQDVVLRLTDGTEIALTGGMDGSGCSGGTDTSEPGRLFLARRAGTLLDLDALESISVCGAEIPLK